ncbi:17062_t:CDS:10 [Cetraspora pellucida]|uniref:17062_t:CDS:1 n=1 Tax=Cetraspora pellucida TaxID=1433469 RepID=A0ACA9L1Y0_9GLOM|nr:17062_t:CDS:10 [Cetraspora pellucida]
MSQNNNKQALNVKDALSYLDQVKVQFSEQPDVYNRFLDIMKDFKSQAIDTPGVIERVSSLFKGHPALIQGFNTFLPPGYHIECSTNPHDPDSIRVTTPSGTTTTSIGPMDPHHGPTLSTVSNITSSGYYSNASYPHPPPHSLMPTLQPHPPGSSMPTQTVSYRIGSPQQSVGQSVAQQTIAQAVQSVGLGVAENTSPQQQGKKAPLVDSEKFNIVIYRIVINSYETDDENFFTFKNRFSTEPDTYKQFLEILQTYQKEQKPIQEVYSQVQVLFKNAPDLLDEFKQFLPDTSGNVASGGLFGPILQNHGTPKQSHLLPAISAIANSGSGHGATRLPSVGNFSSQSSVNLSVNDTFKKGSGIGSTNNGLGSVVGPNSTGSSSVNKKKRSGLPNSDRSPSLISSKPKKSKLSHKPSGDQVHASSSSIPVKLESQKAMEPQPLASTEELEFFEKAKKYISNKHSYNEFLKLLNLYSQEILDGQSLLKYMAPFLGGTSSDLYAWLKQFLKLNERDEIVQNTANSRPRVDLEGCISYGPSYRQLPESEANMPCSGRDELCYEVLNDKWVSHPTWASEEAGFVSHKKNQFEEALHKSNLHTIHLLEPIEKKINTKLTPEEKAKFKLEPGLGGQSMIYQRIIKKVYDVEKGLEVIDALHNNPCTAVPREWNKIWREIDAKNYYKSLDHQGITFKNDDKKALTPKYLVAEIENLRREPSDEGEPAEYQFKFIFKDLEVFKDVARILFGYMDRSLTVAPSDREKIERFFKTFVPSFFELPPNMFDGLNHEDSAMLVDNEETSTNISTDNIDGEPLNAEPISGMWIQVSKESRENIRAVVANAGNAKQKKKSTCYFFGNNSFYCFFRFLQESAQEISSSTSQVRGPSAVATELGLLPDRIDPDVDMDLNKGDPYAVMLELIEKQFDGDMELPVFEECLRYIYGTKAYIMFTVDKLVQNMTKQVNFKFNCL